MAKDKKKSDFRFSQSHVEQLQVTSAESEKDLASYYVDNHFFRSAWDRESRKSFFIGRTGVGKTAILHRVKEQLPEKSALFIDPEEFAFHIMDKSEVLKALDGQVSLDLFYKTLWKYIFVTEILKKRFGSERRNWLARQLDEPFNKAAERAYKFLLKNSELDDGQTFGERISGLISRMEHNVSAEFARAGITFKYNGKLTPDQKALVQTALSKFELVDLNYFIKGLDDAVLEEQFVILVDDLDKTWIQNSVGIDFTRCLFETVFELNQNENLKIIVALRTNLFEQLRFHQSEKYLPYFEGVYWSDNELKNIFEKRVSKVLGVKIDHLWSDIFPSQVKLDNGKAKSFFEYLISRTNRRPRDLILFLSYIAKESLNKGTVKSEAVSNAEKKYSKGRLKALEEEWANPYVNLDQVFQYFSQRSYKLTCTDFKNILDDIAQEAVSSGGSLPKWLLEQRMIDSNSFDTSELAKFFYKIGFIGWKPFPDDEVKYAFAPDSDDMHDPFKSSAKFYVNPCYYKALHLNFQ